MPVDDEVDDNGWLCKSEMEPREIESPEEDDDNELRVQPHDNGDFTSYS